MKKFASVLLAVLVAFSMFSFVVSAAAPSLTAKVDKTSVKVGDKVTVTANISENSNLAALTVDVLYDSAAFEVVSIKGAGLFTSEAAQGMEMPNAKYAAGKARFVAIATYALTAGGTAFTAEFKALKDGEFKFELDVVDAETDSGKVTVTANAVNVTVGAAEEPSTEKPSETPSEKPSETPSEKPSEEPTECKHETMSNWATTEPTCKKDGFKVRNCTVCGYEEKEPIPATGVCKNEWVTVKQPTATTKGLQELKCTMCGAVSATRETALADTNNNAGDSLDKPAIPNTDAIA